MSVYVDDLIWHDKAPRSGKWCHMIADTTEELLAVADAIGHSREWLQDAGTPREHFDVFGPTRRAKAIKHGAIPLSRREFVTVLRRKQEIAA